ncbi:sensor histidine kinase [Catenulispora rubra]|uniref:sensor histidine kinase n=1 Tax=Catenulispora rubra TaxID=280293 RepID=UPI0018922A03|nr:histidine kinase [Catenulispora rubra]
MTTTTTSWQRYQRDHPRGLDATTAVLLFAAAIPGSVITEAGVGSRVGWWPAVLLSGVSCVALGGWRRSRPRAVTVLVAVCAVAVIALGYLPTLLVLAPLAVAVFTLADRTDRRTANPVTLAALAVIIGLGLHHGTDPATLALRVVGPIGFLLLPVALGTTARIRRDYLDAVRERAEAAERNREQEARRRVAEERIRIARDLHDVVAHHLALANAQATTAAHLATTRPEQSRKILAELTETTHLALKELKATVGLLREADDSEAPLDPAPGLARLPDLVASFGAAGLAVRVASEGTAYPLAPLVDLTAFRIVQESLTNVAKHSAAKTAELRLAYARDRLTITVANGSGARPAADVGSSRDSGSSPGPGSGSDFSSDPSSSSGFGQVGMRERARAVGGTLRAGPRADGGYEVVATLPAIVPSPQEDPQP